MKPSPPPPDMAQMLQTWLGFAGLLLVALISGIFLLRSKDKENTPKGRELDQQLADQIRQDLQEERQAARDQLAREQRERVEDAARTRARELQLLKEISDLGIQLNAALRGQEAHEVAARVLEHERERQRLEVLEGNGSVLALPVAATAPTVPLTASLAAPAVPTSSASPTSASIPLKGTDSL